MRLARRFFAKEQRYLELTFEAFNLFNTVNYNGINNVVGTACVANFAIKSELCRRNQRDSDQRSRQRRSFADFAARFYFVRAGSSTAIRC